MLQRIDDHWTRGTHIIFRNLGRMNGSTGYQRTTNIYEVLPKGEGLQLRLGVIKWFGRWRKYVFSPYAETVYEETCMREISQFIEEETKAQIALSKARRKAEKATKEAAHVAALRFIWVKCGDCKFRWKQEDGEYTGPRPCRKCGLTNTTETDVKKKAAKA